jgi:nitrate reductase gamma subunit
VSAFAFVVGALLPYLTIVVFVAGMAYRFHSWYKTPNKARMSLFYVNEKSTFRGVLEDVLLFPGLFKGDRLLWSFSWIFHATLALVVLGHIRVFTGLADSLMISMGMSTEGIDGLSATAGGIAGIVLLATAVLLLVRRFTIPRVREISRGPDFIALLLLLVIIITGDIMRFGAHFDLEQTRVWAASLLTLAPVVPANNWFLLHALTAQLLIIFIPFSKILHFGGIFFTQSLVKARYDFR